ncbi:hypothetical protein HYR99_10110 [Candidatus Poribacteria bacterium]|nr:hypothetical protein [Candidatus Poribacteria bacterium]
MNRHLLYITIGLLIVVGAITTASANDLAIYSGPTNPGWISIASAKKNADTIMNDSRIKKIFKDIKNFGDGEEVGYNSPLGKWVTAHTGDRKQDVLITASGTAPSALYPFPNKEPDGSNIEKFIEDGNVLINVADWILYMSYEGGTRSPDNAAAGAANVFDIPGLTFGNRGGPQKPTAEGLKYIPSLKEFQSARPWHLEQFNGTDWVVTAFAKADDTTTDPAVAVNKVYGGVIAAMWQKDAPDWTDGPDPRGIGVVEFIANWLTEKGNLTAVDPQGKLATTWGKIKSRP